MNTQEPELVIANIPTDLPISLKGLTKMEESKEDNIDDKANSFLEQISDPKLYDLAINSIADEEVSEIISLSKFLNKPIEDMSDNESNSNQISVIILDLKNKMEEISPSKSNIDGGFIEKFLVKLGATPGIQKYLNKFKTYSELIENIISKLEVSANNLKIDNTLFIDDKLRLNELIKSLNTKIKVLGVVIEKLNNKIENTKDEQELIFLKQEVLYNLNIQVMDLQQIVMTAMQGILALDVLIKNNNELFRSSKRVKTVTMLALNVGVMVSVGLSNQKKVFDITNTLTNTSNEIINKNSELLKSQGLDIQKQASSNILNMNNLRESIETTLSAIEDVENYRILALPEMLETINKTQTLISKLKLKKIGEKNDNI